ncbi:MAG: hypothetical protein MR038_00310 [Oscillospiraceae bacterium]|nr:hypothetical protein [Oscillospiraceae bacterium]
MTQTVSKRSNSPAVHYGLSLAKRNFKFGILSLCMNFLGLPMFLIAVLAEAYQMKAETPDWFTDKASYRIVSVFGVTDEIYIFIAAVCTIAAVLSGVFIAMGSFSHLFDKQRVDMDFSLPLTADKRFFAGYLSGLGVYVLPYIFCQIISLILLTVGRLTVDTWVSGLQAKVFEDFTPMCIKLIFGGLVIMTMFYTLFVLTMCFCGSRFETGAYGVGANFCLPVIYFCIDWLISDESYGLVFRISDDTPINHLFGCTSPIGAICGLYLTLYPDNWDRAFYSVNSSAADYSFFSVYSFGFWVIKCLAVTALLVFCAYRLYRRRTAEQTGRIFISKTFYYFVMVCLMMILSVFVSESSTGIFPMLIVTAAVFLIMDCVSNRGIKKLGRSVGKYAVIMAVLIGGYLITDNTGYFGAEDYVPDPGEVKCAELYDYEGYYSTDLYTGTYRFEDEKNIKMITDAHNMQLDEYNSSAEAVRAGCALGIKYTLKSGAVVKRYYSDAFCCAYEELLPLEVSGEMKEQKLAALKTTAEDKALCIASHGTENYPNLNKKTYSEDFASGLINSLTEDINAMTTEDYSGHGLGNDVLNIGTGYLDDNSYVIPSGAYYEVYTLTEAYPRTLEYLSSYGIEPYHEEYTAADIASLDGIELRRVSADYRIPVSHSWDMSETLAVIYDPDYYGNRYEYSNYPPKDMRISDLTEEQLTQLAEIASDAVKNYIPDKDYYSISINGNTDMYIPEKYNDIIESIIS